MLNMACHTSEDGEMDKYPVMGMTELIALCMVKEVVDDRKRNESHAVKPLLWRHCHSHEDFRSQIVYKFDTLLSDPPRRQLKIYEELILLDVT
jgi:hypothetical protein